MDAVGSYPCCVILEHLAEQSESAKVRGCRLPMYEVPFVAESMLQQ